MHLGVVKALVVNDSDRYGFVEPFFCGKEIYLRHEFFRDIEVMNDNSLTFVPANEPHSELEVGAPIVFESIEGESRRRVSAWCDFVAYARLQIHPDCREEFRQLRLGAKKVAKMWREIYPYSAADEVVVDEAGIIRLIRAQNDLNDWAMECVHIGVPLHLVTFLLWSAHAI